ncbi:hypothetical protein JST97_30085 [bacterium]|nr:hypothetical protein [bacterium]
MFAAAKLFALPKEEAPAPSPAEKVLLLAENLDHNLAQLEAEAMRVEQLLETLSQPASEIGNQFMQEFVAVLEGQLNGIYGLLDYQQCGDQELLQQSLQCLVDSDARLCSLESNLEQTRQELPLVA